MCAAMRGVPEPPAEVVERAKAIPCTCTRLDVDEYDTRGCEACGDDDPEDWSAARADFERQCYQRVADEDCGGQEVADVRF